MPFSNYEADLRLNGRFRDGGAIPALGTVYVALASADLTRTNVTANELVIGTGGYARIPIPTTNADWTAPVDSGGRRMISNANTITGFTASANINGGNPISYGGIYDAATAGNLIAPFQFGTPVTILSGQVASIPPGAITIAE